MGVNIKVNIAMIYLVEKVKLISTVGTFYTAMGDKYDGEWKNGKKNGKGKVYSNVVIY